MTSVANGYRLGPRGWYKQTDGSGPYAIDSNGTATLIAGIGVAPLPAFAYQAETTAYLAAFTGTTPSDRRAKSYDRRMRRHKAQTYYATKLKAFGAIGRGEANFLRNSRSPGTHDLTKNGAATAGLVYTDDSGFVSGVTADHYISDIGLTDIGSSYTVGFYSRTASALSGVEFGAQDSVGNGVTINARNGTNQRVCRATGVGAITSTLTAPYSETGYETVSVDSGGYRFEHDGITKESGAVTYVAPLTNVPLWIGAANGNASHNFRNIAGWMIAYPAMTQTELATFCAIERDYIERCIYGDLDIYESGVAPSTATADLVVYGTNIGGLLAAYEAARAGLSVAVICEPYVKNEWGIGGMTAAGGLGYIDVNTLTTVSGMYRQMIAWINSTPYGGRSNTNSQTNLSAETKVWHMALRRMFDALTLSAAGLLTPYDVKFYMSTGIKSVQKSGAKITSITTNDGRTFTAGTAFVEGDYEGLLSHLAGCPTITGTEAAGGSGIETNNGYHAANVQQIGASNNLSLDPYVTPATSASGLLPDIIAMPAITDGAADPALESMNYRLPLTKTASRLVPFAAAPSPSYNASRFEVFGRWYAAEATIRLTNNVLLKQDAVGPNGGFDINNGSGGLSTDLAQSGTRYSVAADDTARLAVAVDVFNYDWDFFYWHLHSGDSRIPANLLADFQAYGLDSSTFLDPGMTGQLFWPSVAYQRDPIWQLQNAGYVYNGGQMVSGDGTTPNSVKTFAVGSYFFADRHAPNMVNNAGVLERQGAVSIVTQPGNTDGVFPIPAEAYMPDAAVCTNLLCPSNPSVTKIAWYGGARMEPAIGQAGQTAGAWAAEMKSAGVTAQAVTYANVVARLQADVDTVKSYLPVVN